MLGCFKILRAVAICCILFGNVSCTSLYKTYSAFRQTDVDYLSYYLPKNYLYINNIECKETSTNITVRLQLKNTYNKLVNYKVDELKSKPATIDSLGMMSFELSKEGIEMLERYFVVSVYEKQKLITKRNLAIIFAPRERYEASGQTQASMLIIRKDTTNEIPFVDYKFDNYQAHKPSVADIEFARQEWGHLFSDNDKVLDKAKKLHIAICRRLQSFQGVPSDSMLLAKPFKQYAMAIDGQGKLWCSNWTDIFTYAAACFNIRTRIVRFGNYLRSDHGVDIKIGEGHAFFEVYDPVTNNWVAEDLLFGLLEMTFRGNPLNAQDLLFMLNSPLYYNKLVIKGYDWSKDKVYVKRMSRMNSAKYYYNEYKINQKVSYDLLH
jgi:hypothetical protein